MKKKEVLPHIKNYQAYTKTLIEHARVMIFEHSIPYFLWPEAVAYACYLKNQSPTHALKNFITPKEAFMGKKPNISMLGIWN